MKPLALVVTLCLLGTAAFAGDLTNAAKGAKAKRKKSMSKVITNADVKKSKGKIADTPNLSSTVEKQPSMLEEHEAKRAAEKVAHEFRLKHDRLVADLEKELAALEQRYYEENDLNRRDTEIVKKFNDVKARLEAALAQVK
jgi:phage-related minor tail protein